jgi:glycosyltransferase involved in cell wall biosynthesis
VRRVIRASVIVPARDAEATLPRALERLRAQRAPFDYEVIVVDDGSSDRTAELAAGAGEPVRLVRQDPKGPAAARNAGVGASSGEALAFCDADCFATEDWLASGVRALDHAGLVQGKVLPEAGVNVGPFDRTLWITEEVGLWETANLFVSREAFERVGGFEDWLRPVAGKAMAEDVWFGWRVKRLGAQSTFCPEALAYHAVFPRAAVGYVAEYRRRRHFPEMAAKMPELRDAFFYRRFFLNSRSAAFDVALVGVLAGLLLRRPWPLIAAAPYARHVRRRAAPYGRYGAKIAAVDLAADLVGAWALARGSLKARSPVL